MDLFAEQSVIVTAFHYSAVDNNYCLLFALHGQSIIII